MIGSVKARRTIGLLVLLMAALLVLSAALGPEADAKKKKKINVVQCADIGQICEGTERRDRLVGTIFGENISGGEGNDIYEGNGGNDGFFDNSPTSSDTYRDGASTIVDDGGTADSLDLGILRLGDDLGFVRDNNDLLLDAPGVNDIFIEGHFGAGRIEKIKFANAIVTGTQTESLAREATPEEQAALEEKRPDDERPPEDESASQEKE
jgi:hypothetical protein